MSIAPYNMRHEEVFSIDVAPILSAPALGRRTFAPYQDIQEGLSEER